MISWRNFQLNTDRIDRTVRKVMISRDFVRAVLHGVSTASGPLPSATASTDRVSPA
jgi:hypothetical protein